MRIHLLKDIDNRRKNVESVSFPYLWNIDTSKGDADKVIYFGTNFLLLPHAKKDEVARLIDLTLDYVRRNCKGYKLYYKPHPGETEEQSLINLNGFEIIREKNNAELFLREHHKEIKCAFSHNSTASAVAWGFGINSYVFLEPLRKCAGDTLTDYWKEVLFDGLPPSFFINSFSDILEENSIADISAKIPDSLLKIIKKRPKKIWFVMTNISYLATTMSLSKHIRQINPDQKIALVVSKHARWGLIDMNSVRAVFDEIIMLPRSFYSLRINRIWKSLMLSHSVKNIKTDSSDIIFGFSSFELVENAFISYHKSNLKVLFINWDEINMGYKISRFNFFKNHLLSWAGASIFYNKILEPWFGLEKTVYMSSKENKLINLIRYEKPPHEIYDRVYIFSLSLNPKS